MRAATNRRALPNNVAALRTLVFDLQARLQSRDDALQAREAQLQAGQQELVYLRTWIERVKLELARLRRMQFGRAGGAITNVTLKSGGNNLKGSVFAFGNNEKTNAPGYFTHTAPPGDYLQSGFTLGGPIQHNKVFFFGDYQHIRDNAGRTTRAAPQR